MHFYFIRIPFFFLILCLTSSCSPITRHYVQVETFISKQEYEKADKVIEENQKKYGSKNRLLYLLDRGMTLHLSGRFSESNQFLHQAEQWAEQLYTKSIISETGAFFTNDNTLPYAGEDFERVMIHLISALNYIYLEDLDEALVEARKIDHQLNLLNDRYEKKSVYRQDAFARYLSGKLFEAKKELNDALIAYRKAYEAYQEDQKNYGIDIPEGLMADLLRLTDFLGFENENRQYQETFRQVQWMPQKEYRQLAEVVFNSFNGLSPVKEDFFITAPVPDGRGGIYILNVAMPRFVRRPSNISYALVEVWNPGGSFSQKTVPVQDISGIAIKNLEDRVGRITAKAIARASSKFLLSQGIRKMAAKDQEPVSLFLAELGTNLFSLFSEQSDKRSWRTLPGEIQMAGVLVPPGKYQVRVQYFDSFGQQMGKREAVEIEVTAGEKVFLGGRVVIPFTWTPDRRN